MRESSGIGPSQSSCLDKELAERHQREASCVSCHVRMDPFGFALEGFDVIGKKRTRYANGLPVEEDGILRDGTPIVGYPGIRQYFKDILIFSTETTAGN